MNPKRKKRLILVLFLVFGVGVSVSLALYALNQNINLFYSPLQIANGEAPENTRIRAGGMVVEGSVVRDQQSLHVKFEMTDYAKTVPVEFTGILPDLFREGQGIVAQGSMDAQGVFQAVEVLAKHDENYMPPEVADALEKSGKMPTPPKEAYNK
ncbi:cytochrome c maturation protein CcmE [Neptunomonas sp.]|uniref:cytochrome c maturation protein CcmE n=1 Tax=Neptunomonas sp. TaxID=1971898 RepID=UPI0035685CB6